MTAVITSSGLVPPPPSTNSTRVPIVYQVRTPYNSNLGLGILADPPFVPLTWLQIEIGAPGDVIYATGQFVTSSAAGSPASYPGFAFEYFSSGTLWMTPNSLVGVQAVPLASGIFIDPQGAADAWAIGSSGTNSNPYATHRHSGAYVATAADVGTRWLALLGWATSFSANPGDYVVSFASQLSLDVLRWRAE